MKYLFNSFFLIMYIRGFQIDDFVLLTDLIYANLKWEVYDHVVLSNITYFNIWHIKFTKLRPLWKILSNWNPLMYIHAKCSKSWSLLSCWNFAKLHAQACFKTLFLFSGFLPNNFNLLKPNPLSKCMKIKVRHWT